MVIAACKFQKRKETMQLNAMNRNYQTNNIINNQPYPSQQDYQNYQNYANYQQNNRNPYIQQPQNYPYNQPNPNAYIPPSANSINSR
jgi:hypothetical protein